MGMTSEKAILDGLFGGVTIGKTSKRTFVTIMKPGPKLEKVEVTGGLPVPSGLLFGASIRLCMTNAEQKFQDFNGSFTVAESAVIQVPKQ
ncbi:MAG: hypothetical protein PHH28_03340 [Desulfuromonadaceae bacterium]|nr:hypothetical protein [Desulfuromonadaceae bacterium]